MDTLNAVAWMQTSVEYRASAMQAWAAAGAALPKALKDRKWTAAIEQTGKFKKLPPAIIVDIDETVLDNSPVQARFLLEGDGRYTRAMWEKWTQEGAAKPIPGAVEFLKLAASRGVTVFYVSNRAAAESPGTLANLNRHGFPITSEARGGLGDSVLLRDEKEGWGGDKTSRRQAVAAHYRIIMLCGDDLGDFLPARRPRAERDSATASYMSWFGQRWIVLPNPSYGSWEDTLSNFDRSLSAGQARQNKLKALVRD
jgi:acid phosphatase